MFITFIATILISFVVSQMDATGDNRPIGSDDAVQGILFIFILKRFEMK